MSAYDALAGIYDGWQDRYGCFAAEVLKRLELELDGFRGVDSFLDLGCGTGTLLLAIGAHHPEIRLAGIDGSAGMIERARSKPGAHRVRFREGRLGEAIAPPAYRAVGCFFNTLNHLSGVRELESAFRSVTQALPPDGRFLFDLNNEVGFARWWRGVDRCSGRGWRLRIRSSFDAARGTARARLQVKQGGGAFDVTVEERLFDDDEILRILSRLDLSIVAREAWAPLGDGVPGSTFWHVRRGP